MEHGALALATGEIPKNIPKREETGSTISALSARSKTAKQRHGGRHDSVRGRRRRGGRKERRKAEPTVYEEREDEESAPDEDGAEARDAVSKELARTPSDDLSVSAFFADIQSVLSSSMSAWINKAESGSNSSAESQSLATTQATSQVSLIPSKDVTFHFRSLNKGSKLLFDIPRPTIPIYVRDSMPATTANPNGNATVTWADDHSANSMVTWVKSDLEFPVRRIYCVGRNFREHATEKVAPLVREQPYFFQKPADAVVVCDPLASAVTLVPYPTLTTSLHFEGELIVAMKGGGSSISLEQAMNHVYGYSIGCDLTRRDLQSDAKKSRRPWDASKGFDKSCPCSPIVPKEDFDLEGSVTIQLEVNDSVRQQSAIGKMIYSVPELISNLSQMYFLGEGDLILTGTPAGVSELTIGDVVLIRCGELIPCEFKVGESEKKM